MLVNNSTGRIALALILLIFYIHDDHPVNSSAGSINPLTEKEDVLIKEVVTKRDTTDSRRLKKWCYQSAECKQGANGSGWIDGVCKDGRIQSPIDLDPGYRLLKHPFRAAFKPSDHILTNFTLANAGGKISLTPLANNWTGIRFRWETDEYILHHLEFHWGPYDDIGSEHTIGDVSASMEMQLFYWYSKWGTNYSQALDSGEMGAIGIIGVFLVADPSMTNESALEPIVSNLANLTANNSGGGGGGEQKVDVENQTLNLSNILPSGSPVFSYHGSMTSPPCQEIVLWFVLRSRAFIKPEDVEAFRNAIKDEDGNWVKMNYRKRQVQNKRQIEFGLVE